MKFTATRLPDVVLIEPAVFGDDRGWFMERFSLERFADGLAALGLALPRPFVQGNESFVGGRRSARPLLLGRPGDRPHLAGGAAAAIGRQGRRGTTAG